MVLLSLLIANSRTTQVYLLQSKDEVFSYFKLFHKMVCTQFNAKIKILSDSGTEFTYRYFQNYLGIHGIIHQTSCVETLARNGVAERKNRHMLDVARSLMFTMNVPKTYWGNAILTAAYLTNQMPLQVIDFRSLCELLQGTCSFIIPPKIFGCVCFVHNHRRAISKLDPRTLKCIFIRYSATQKGYK